MAFFLAVLFEVALAFFLAVLFEVALAFFLAVLFAVALAFFLAVLFAVALALFLAVVFAFFLAVDLAFVLSEVFAFFFAVVFAVELAFLPVVDIVSFSRDTAASCGVFSVSSGADFSITSTAEASGSSLLMSPEVSDAVSLPSSLTFFLVTTFTFTSDFSAADATAITGLALGLRSGLAPFFKLNVLALLMSICSFVSETGCAGIFDVG